MGHPPSLGKGLGNNQQQHENRCDTHVFEHKGSECERAI